MNPYQEQQTTLYYKGQEGQMPYQPPTMYQPYPQQPLIVNSYPVPPVQDYPQQPLYSSRPIHQTKDDSSTAFLLFVVGFFFHLIWIVNYLMFRNSPDEQARRYAKYSVIGFGVTMVLAAAITVLSVVVVIIFSSISTKLIA